MPKKTKIETALIDSLKKKFNTTIKEEYVKPNRIKFSTTSDNFRNLAQAVKE